MFCRAPRKQVQNRCKAVKQVPSGRRCACVTKEGAAAGVFALRVNRCKAGVKQEIGCQAGGVIARLRHEGAAAGVVALHAGARGLRPGGSRCKAGAKQVQSRRGPAQSRRGKMRKSGVNQV